MSNNVDNHSEDLFTLRKREVAAQEKTGKKQTITIMIQSLALLLAAVATAAAAWAAWQAGKAVEASQHIASDQELENRLQTAITAIGDKSQSSQVAGLTLLRRTVRMQISAAMNGSANRQDAEDAYDAYSTALDVIPTYLRQTTKLGTDHPIAAYYAAAELKNILGMGPDVQSIVGRRASIDLALVGMAGVDWTNINFDSLAAAWMKNIDLRGADLIDSHWGTAALIGAHLQCADLTGADLSHADLTGADLRGANLTDAKFPSAVKEQRPNTDGAVGNQGWTTDHPAAATYQLESCMKIYKVP